MNSIKTDSTITAQPGELIGYGYAAKRNENIHGKRSELVLREIGLETIYATVKAWKSVLEQIISELLPNVQKTLA